MIWGLTLEPGKDYTQLVQDEVQLSMATMESRGCIGSKDEKYSHVMMKTTTAEYMLCTLVSGVTFQQGLDLKLMPNDEVTFSVHGTNKVYLTGYSYISMDTNEDQQDWIEEQTLDDSLAMGSDEYIDDDESPYPQVSQDSPEGSEGNGEEEYTVMLDPGMEQQHGRMRQTPDEKPMSGQPQQQSTDILGVDIKSEIISDSEVEQLPGQQPLTSEHADVRVRPPDLPSTSAEVIDVNIKPEVHPVVEIDNQPSDQMVIEEQEGVRGQTINLPAPSAGRSKELSEERMREIEQNWSRLFPGGSGQPSSSGVIRSNVLPTPRLIPPHRPSGHPTSLIPPPASNLPHRLTKRQPDLALCEAGQRGGCVIPQEPTQRQRLGWKYTCHYCGRVFRDQQSKLVHEIRHRCRFCQKEFQQVKYTHRHEATHTLERRHKCRFCEKRFRVQSTKIQHERTHTGERPYKCGYCDMWFNHRESKRRHERKHFMPVT